MTHLSRNQRFHAGRANAAMHTFVTVLVVIIVARATLGHAQRQSPKEQPPDGVTIVTGDQLPAYLVWQLALFALGGGDPEAPSMARTLPLTDQHRATILKHAQADTAAQLATREQQRKKLDSMLAAGAKPGSRAVKEALALIDYEQRVRTMRTRDAILAELPEEERYVFEQWVEKWRNGTKRYLPTRDLDLFLMQP